jgi:hypothetical protein
MTKTQAAELQVKWKELVDPPACEHLKQEMESSDGYSGITVLSAVKILTIPNRVQAPPHPFIENRIPLQLLQAQVIM